MKNRLTLWAFVLTLFCLAMVSTGALAEFPEDDMAILRLLFPEAVLTPADDFYYVMQEASGDAYHVRVQERRTLPDSVWVAVELRGQAHVSGFQGYCFALCKQDGSDLLGEVLRFYADQSSYYFGYREGIPYVLLTYSTTYQGYESCGGGKWAFIAGAWQAEWPHPYASAEYDAYWASRKGVLFWEQPGVMEIHTRVFNPQGQGNDDPSDYTWALESMEELLKAPY